VNHEPFDPVFGPEKKEVIFFRTGAGGEPVREWLRSLSPIEDRKQIGVDIKTVEFGWPQSDLEVARKNRLSMRAN
jgi:hypothetical protein